jgi:hypothetical protein
LQLSVVGGQAYVPPLSDVLSVQVPKEEPVAKSRSIAVSGGTAVQLDGVDPRQVKHSVRMPPLPPVVPVAPPVPPVLPMPPVVLMPPVIAMPPVSAIPPVVSVAPAIPAPPAA